MVLSFDKVQPRETHAGSPRKTPRGSQATLNCLERQRGVWRITVGRDRQRVEERGASETRRRYSLPFAFPPSFFLFHHFFLSIQCRSRGRGNPGHEPASRSAPRASFPRMRESRAYDWMEASEINQTAGSRSPISLPQRAHMRDPRCKFSRESVHPPPDGAKIASRFISPYPKQQRRVPPKVSPGVGPSGAKRKRGQSSFSPPQRGGTTREGKR